MSDLLAPQLPNIDLTASVLDEIAAGASDRDSAVIPPFPEDAFLALARAGLMSWGATPGAARPPAAEELALVRSVAHADGSVGRIYDGHLNAIERLAVQGPAELRDNELAAFASGELRGGVWGGDPGPGEGDPAQVVTTADGLVLRGVKTFCSGAGGIHRALVLARTTEAGPTGAQTGAQTGGQTGGQTAGPLSVWIDLTARDRVEIDSSWYRSHGLRASVSHRVIFHDAPVLGVLGPPGAIAAQPWFARDALRTAASWAGMADAAAQAALHELAQRPGRGPLEALAAGRIMTAQQTISVWLRAAASAMDVASDELPQLALHGRASIADACRALLDEAARACGSRPFARGGRLDRARRDLEVFLLQHRLDPLLARAGQARLDVEADG